MSNTITFTPEHDAFRQMVRKFVETEINPLRGAVGRRAHLPGPRAVQKDGHLGLLGLSYPEEYGGGGVDYWWSTVFLEELGRAHCAGVPMGIAVHTDMATPALAELGTHEQKENFCGRLLPASRLLHCRQRTGRRFRRGRHSHPRRGRRRRLRDQRLQDVDHQRHPGRHYLPAGPHRRRARLQGHVAHHCAHRHARL
jgi:hypothetical protein